MISFCFPSDEFQFSNLSFMKRYFNCSKKKILLSLNTFYVSWFVGNKTIVNLSCFGDLRVLSVRHSAFHCSISCQLSVFSSFIPLKRYEKQLLLLLGPHDLPEMKTAHSHHLLATLMAVLLLSLEWKALYGSVMTYTCHDGFMSIYIAKEQFAPPPSAIYIQGKSTASSAGCWPALQLDLLLVFNTDERGGYHQVVALAEQCGYLLRETETLVILTVTSDGCFVRRSVSLFHGTTCQLLLEVLLFEMQRHKSSLIRLFFMSL